MRLSANALDMMNEPDLYGKLPEGWYSGFVSNVTVKTNENNGDLVAYVTLAINKGSYAGREERVFCTIEAQTNDPAEQARANRRMKIGVSKHPNSFN